MSSENSLNIFRDYVPASFNVGELSLPWINFGLDIPSSEADRLVEHVVRCGSSNQYLTGIRKGRGWGVFYLPIIKTPEFKSYLTAVATEKYLEPESYINMEERTLLTCNRGERIFGIYELNGLPLLTVNEVEAIRNCMQSYVTLDEKVKEAAYDEFKDPVTTEILSKPIIASDGHTYSKNTLIQLFKTTRISPITREELVPIGKAGVHWDPDFAYNGRELGIPNLKVKQLLEKFVEGKLKVSQQKYLKYKSKYVTLKNNLS